MFTKKNWELSIGFYQGVLFGVRTYESEEHNTHVLYFLFIDFALIVEK